MSSLFKNAIMLTRIFLGLTCFILAIQCQAQTAASISGTWVFSRVETTKVLDSVSKQMVQQIFGASEMRIAPNHRYSIFLMDELDAGFWDFSAKDSLVHMMADKGTMGPSMIVSGAELKVIMDEEGSIFFKKKSDSFPVLQVPVITGLQHAKESELVNKWIFDTRVDPGKDSALIATTNELFRDITSLTLNKDHSFISAIGKLATEGRWYLAEDNTRLILEMEDGSRFWLIQSVADGKLKLRKGYSPEIYTYRADSK